MSEPDPVVRAEPDAGRGNPSIKRRRYLVESGAQSRILLWVLLHLAASLALTLLLVLLPTLLRLREGGLAAGGQLEAGREQVFFGWPLAAAVAVLLVVAAVNTVALTNRIFGPAARLRRVVRRWREEGAWPQSLVVRRRDFHGELLEEVDAAVEAAREDADAASGRLRAAASRARGLATRLGTCGDADSARVVADDCDAALKHLERLGRRPR